jgi:arylsulfatase A
LNPTPTFSRRTFLAGSLAAGGWAAACAARAAGAEAKSEGASAKAGGPSAGKQPNVVLILVDDWGNRSLSAFGGAVPTPHLDRLAREGMVFTHAHAAPMCAPTRDEMLTGCSRARFKGRPGADVPFFTNHLQRLGYATGMAGRWFVGSVFDPPLRGFDESCILVNGYRHWAPDVMVWGSKGAMKDLNQPPVRGRLNEWEIPLEGDARHTATRLPDRYAEHVAFDFLADFLERHRDGPFFAYYSSKLVHVPHAPTPDADPDEVAVFKAAFAGIYNRHMKGLREAVVREAKRRGVRLPGHKAYRNKGIAYLDQMVGRLVAELEALGLRENTLILFTSDNGNSGVDPVREGVETLPGRKGDSREGGTRVPFVANWPGHVEPGSTCDDLVHVQDLGPTLLDLAGGRMPADRPCDGSSFAPQLLGRKGEPREYVVGWGAHPNLWVDRVAEELERPDLKPFKLVWVHGHRYKLYNDGRFYDLRKDLAETDRIPPGEGSPEAERTRRRFQAILDEYK